MKKLVLSTLLLTLVFGLISCEDPAEVLAPAEEPEFEVSVDHFITLEDAQADLMQLLADIDTPLSRNGKSRSIKSSFSQVVGSKASRSADSLNYTIHIFNFDDNQGFAIMSGDDRVPSLIALAESGNYNGESQTGNPGFDLFMEGTAALLAAGGDGDSPNDWAKPGDSDIGIPIMPFDHMVITPWENHIYKENGYCTVKWGQRDPYNMYCPVGTPTGCVATATAQIMSFHRHPDSYNGYTFDWNEMTAAPKISKCSTIGVENLARLMQQLGLPSNLDMDYDENGSGAYTGYIPRTLEAFNYSQGGVYKDYDISDIKSEIENGYPLIIRGRSPYSGHCWVIHGLLRRSQSRYYYDENDKLLYTLTSEKYYPLCNWGWEESDDGYYLSNSFDSSHGREYLDDGTPGDKKGCIQDHSGKYNYELKTITQIRK